MRAMTKSPCPPTTRRASRRKRLPYALVSETLDFKPTEANWDAMESAYHHPLADDDRKEIVEVVKSYFSFALSERNASYVGDSVKWLAKVRKTAEVARNAMEVFSKELFPDEQLKTENGAEFHARFLIERHLKEQRRLPESTMEDVQDMLIDFLDAIALAAKELEESTFKGHVEGRAWNGLIIGLTQWFAGKGRPVKASKDTRAKPSAFVAFVWQLQLTFPKEYQLHMTTEDALATAMGVARKGMSRRDGSLKPEERS